MNDSWVHSIRDKARQLIHQLSHFLGEASARPPASIRDAGRAQNLIEVDFPSFKILMPYESVDEDNLFINRTTAGFGLHVLPASGADMSLMKSMAELFKTKLPIGVDCTVMLYKHHYIGRALAYNYEPIMKKGGVHAELARRSLEFHLKAIKEGYPNGRNIPAQLADYRCYFFLSCKKVGDFQTRLKHLRDDFSSELKVAGLAFERVDRNEFQRLLNALTSPNLDDLEWPESTNHEELLGDVVIDPSILVKIEDRAMNFSTTNGEGDEHTVRVIQCELSGYPNKDTPWALWQTPDLFANLMHAEHGIQSPFVISFTIRGTNQERLRAAAKRRAQALSKNLNAIQVFMNPGIKDEAEEWSLVHEEASKGNLDLFPTFYTVMLLTTEEHGREHSAKAISAFRQCGFTLTPTPCKQWLRYLGSLPFLLSEGLFESYETLGMTKTLSHYNIANLMPIVAEFKGSRSGLILPTYRHQLFFFDPFDDHNLPITNYNRLTIASSGSGKSFFQLALLQEAQSRDHLTFVIDLGGSYKHLCEMVGGTYIDASTLSLNPFTLFDFDGVTEIAGEKVNDYVQIRDLLGLMASPHAPLDGVQNAWLLRATLEVWKRYGKDACIDEVIHLLREILTEPESRNDRRLKDLIILLNQYGKEGIYGAMFNGTTPLLNDSNFIVLEMGAFENNPELLTIVMFVMIVIIQGQFYHTDRRIRKQCTIDEAWRVLLGANPVAANFIATGFRTARKHNGGFSVNTQFLGDTTETLQGRAIAASSDTKIIMRQGDFKNYMLAHPDVFDPLQVEMIESFGEAKGQGFSSLMMQFGTAYTFHRYFADPFSTALFSTSGDVFGEIEALLADGVSMNDAVQQIVHRSSVEAA
jgi:conjugal transfer ATP-binding protein TraC